MFFFVISYYIQYCNITLALPFHSFFLIQVQLLQGRINSQEKREYYTSDQRVLVKEAGCRNLF